MARRPDVVCPTSIPAKTNCTRHRAPKATREKTRSRRRAANESSRRPTQNPAASSKSRQSSKSTRLLRARRRFRRAWPPTRRAASAKPPAIRPASRPAQSREDCQASWLLAFFARSRARFSGDERGENFFVRCRLNHGFLKTAPQQRAAQQRQQFQMSARRGRDEKQQPRDWHVVGRGFAQLQGVAQ